MEKEELILNKIKQLHKKLESIPNKKYQITIRGIDGSTGLTEYTCFGDFDESGRLKYKIHNMIEWKSLEGTYDSYDDIAKKLKEYRIKYDIWGLRMVGDYICRNAFEVIGEIMAI